MKHAAALVFVWGSQPPAFSIGYEEPSSPRDSGYTVLFSDSPDPERVGAGGEHPGLSWWCLGCLVDEHPEVGPGLDIARRHGVADLDDGGVWVVGDLSRLEDRAESAV